MLVTRGHCHGVGKRGRQIRHRAISPHGNWHGRHQETRAGARARSVADHNAVHAGVGSAECGETDARPGHARQGHPVQLPRVSNGCRTARAHVQRDGRAERHGLVGWPCSDHRPGRHVNRQYRHVAGQGANAVGEYHAIVACLVGQDIGHRVSGIGGARDIHAVVLPLISRDRVGGGHRRKQNIRPGIHRLALRLLLNGRHRERHFDADIGHQSCNDAQRIGDHHRVSPRVCELNIRKPERRLVRAGNVRIVVAPLIQQRRLAHCQGIECEVTANIRRQVAQDIHEPGRPDVGDCQGINRAGGNCHRKGQVGGQLVQVIRGVSPLKNRPVVAQRQAEVGAGCHCHDVRG